MPLARPFSLVARLALSLAALAVLATARLPEPAPALPGTAALRVPAQSVAPLASPAAWRVALALVLVAGLAAELYRRRAWR